MDDQLAKEHLWKLRVNKRLTSTSHLNNKLMFMSILCLTQQFNISYDSLTKFYCMFISIS